MYKIHSSRGINTGVVEQVKGVGQPRLDSACVRVLKAATHVHAQMLRAQHGTQPIGGGGRPTACRVAV